MSGIDHNFRGTMEVTAAVDTRLIKPPKLPLRDSLEVEEMAASLRERGLIQPIVVRVSGDRFEVVAGVTRFLACKKLHWKSVPCLVRELSDMEAFETALTENVQRRSMNAIEEAQAFKKYIDENGRGGEGRLAKVIGKSQEYISHRLALLSLPEKVQEEVIRGRIKPSTAQEIASLKDEKLQAKLSNEIKEMHLGTVEVRRAVRFIGSKSDGYSKMRKETLELRASSGAIDDQSQPDFVRDQFRDYSSFSDSINRKALSKGITGLRIALVRLGLLIDDLPENSDVRELLLEKRLELHGILDSLIRSKKLHMKGISRFELIRAQALR
ncbi:MAG TPA: ParB/RepB/Spo0J family partition protein [Nitrososphaerales archaeon]|nr:ParB/RepB/Spo0J family partition protein [Nitrososphaerales archaeon]